MNAFLQPRRLPLAAARRNLRVYFARLLLRALSPPEDDDEDEDEEGIAHLQVTTRHLH